jgi:hypothetical protein
MECVETTTLIDNNNIKTVRDNNDYFFHFSSILSLTISTYTLQLSRVIVAPVHTQ